MTATARLLERFLAQAGLSRGCELRDVVDAVHELPYGRARGRDAAAVVESRRGTCSTKHYLLAELIDEGWPDVRVEIFHRIYRLGAREAQAWFHADAAAVVPPEGLVDVHTYLVVDSGEGPITLDVTLPERERWDGHASMPLACGPGVDVSAGTNPEAVKAKLTGEHCDARVREPFIAALAHRRG